MCILLLIVPVILIDLFKEENNISFQKSIWLLSVANFSAQLKGLTFCDVLSSHIAGNGLVRTLVRFFRMYFYALKSQKSNFHWL